MEQRNEIIVVRQLPVIEERLQTIKADVTRRVNEAMSLVVSEDTVKEVKKVRAELNAEYKAFEERRKAVKAAVMAPYDKFEEVYDDCISSVFDKGDKDLKAKIGEVEAGLKKKREQEVSEYFTEYMKSRNMGLEEFINFGHANIRITLSASMKSMKEQAKAFVDRVCDDLTLIDTQEHKDEILYEYKRTLNVAGAITMVTKRHKDIEAAKAREAERIAREQAAREAAAKVAAVAEVLPPPVVAPPVVAQPAVKQSEPILTLNFTVRGTKTKLRELKAFLEKGGYDFK